MWRSDSHQWHVKRNKAIKEAHPDIVKLEGNDPSTFFGILFMTVTHIGMAYLVGTYIESYGLMILIAWIGGGFWANAAGLAMHEASHHLVFKSKWMNVFTGCIGEFPLFFPAYKTFQHYHMIHHQYCTIEICESERKEVELKKRQSPRYDPDLPTRFEAMLFSGNAFTRVCFLLLQPLLYSVRPMVEAPRLLVKEDYICIAS